MTDKKDDLELEVELDKAPPVEVDLDAADGEVKKPDAAEPVEDEGSKSLREQMAAMQASRDREATAREQAEQRAREATERASTAERQVNDSQQQVILGAIDKIKMEGDQAEADYAKAMEEGRYTDAAKFQRAMARAEGRLDQLESAKQNFSAEPKPAKTEGAVRPEPVQQVPVDPVEALAGQLSPQSAAWVRQHPECATDEVMFSEMVAADKRARREGLKADTNEYFSFIEKRLGLGAIDPEPAVERRRAVPAAPVTRDVPGAPTGPRRVRLTAEEQEVAEMNGMTNAEYAKYKLEHEAEKARMN